MHTFNPTADLIIPIGSKAIEANSKNETQPLTTETK